MERTIATLVEAGPDAIQLSPGQAPLLQQLPGPKPALVLRSDVANVYGAEAPSHLFSELVERAVERALLLDAACLCVNLLSLPGEPELFHRCVRNVSRLRAACDPVGMPLMVEPLAFKPGEGGYSVDGDPDRITTLVRQAVELGADVVKADPTDDLAEYPRVIETAAPRPVLVRGGGRASDDEILRRTAEVMRPRRRGDRVRPQRRSAPRPAEITQRLMDIVHGD